MTNAIDGNMALLHVAIAAVRMRSVVFLQYKRVILIADSRGARYTRLTSAVRLGRRQKYSYYVRWPAQ